MTVSSERVGAQQARPARVRLCDCAGLFAVLIGVTSLAACRGGGSDPAPPPPAAQTVTYRATLLEVEITRPADGLLMPVPGLPVAGAELTR